MSTKTTMRHDNARQALRFARQSYADAVMSGAGPRRTTAVLHAYKAVLAMARPMMHGGEAEHAVRVAVSRRAVKWDARWGVQS